MKSMKNSHMPLSRTDLVTVCDQCLRACCWQGEFMCDGAINAGILKFSVQELRAMKKVGRMEPENEDWWVKGKEQGI